MRLSPPCLVGLSAACLSRNITGPSAARRARPPLHSRPREKRPPRPRPSTPPQIKTTVDYPLRNKKAAARTLPLPHLSTAHLSASPPPRHSSLSHTHTHTFSSRLHSHSHTHSLSQGPSRPSSSRGRAACGPVRSAHLSLSLSLSLSPSPSRPPLLSRRMLASPPACGRCQRRASRRGAWRAAYRPRPPGRSRARPLNGSPDQI